MLSNMAAFKDEKEKEFALPPVLFKFRSVATEKELSRLIDILNNHRLFFPSRTQINDPFEMANRYIHIGGYAGAWRYEQYEEENPVVTEERNKYHLISLSEDCYSPQMWAYYADSYAGLCLCYVTGRHFNVAKQVEYFSDRAAAVEFGNDPTDDCKRLESLVEKDILCKDICWEHEKEWRITGKETGNYFDYDEDELIGVIIGHKMDDAAKQIVLEHMPKKAKILKTLPLRITNRLGLMRYEDEILYDGSRLPLVGNDLPSLYDYFLNDDVV